MQNYELLYIVSNQYTETEMQKIQAKVNGLIEANGGVIGYQEALGKKKLAYPIKAVAHGYYQVAEFELPEPEKLKIVQTELRLDKEIVRAQIIIKHKITPEEIKRRKEPRAEDGSRIARPEMPARKTIVPEENKTGIKNLDEKLEEILETTDVEL